MGHAREKWYAQTITGGSKMNWLTEFFQKILQFFLKSNYDVIKSELKKAIIEVEKDFNNKDYITDKKQFVIDTVMMKVQANAFLKAIIRFFLSQIIDTIITELNEKLGKDWVNYLDKYFNIIEERYPFLKDDEEVNEKIKQETTK